jgi:hypothetical protein
LFANEPLENKKSGETHFPSQLSSSNNLITEIITRHLTSRKKRVETGYTNNLSAAFGIEPELELEPERELELEPELELELEPEREVCRSKTP